MMTEEKLDMVITMVANLAEQMTEGFARVDERFAQIEENAAAFRQETEQNFDLLRGQIGSVAEALNASNAMRDEEIAAMRQKDAELERMQERHSLDIMALRAAI